MYTVFIQVYFLLVGGVLDCPVYATVRARRCAHAVHVQYQIIFNNFRPNVCAILSYIFADKTGYRGYFSRSQSPVNIDVCLHTMHVSNPKNFDPHQKRSSFVYYNDPRGAVFLSPELLSPLYMYHTPMSEFECPISENMGSETQRKKRKDAGKKREHYVVKDRAFLLYKNRCNGAGIPLPVDRITFRKYADLGCRYCGYTGDRMSMVKFDREYGFVDGNIVPACWTCEDILKLFPGEQEMIDHIRKSYMNIFAVK